MTEVLSQAEWWDEQGLCVSCGSELRDEDVMCCSERCHMLFANYLNWRASFRESSERVDIPKFPFFRMPGS
jgi:hypothetical protein